MRQRLEYVLAWLIIKTIGALPRPLARAVAIALGWLIYLLHIRLRQVGMRNLVLAFPEKTRHERAKILRGVFTSLGRQLAELCLFPKYTKQNVSQVVLYDGFENFERAWPEARRAIPDCPSRGLGAVRICPLAARTSIENRHAAAGQRLSRPPLPPLSHHSIAPCTVTPPWTKTISCARPAVRHEKRGNGRQSSWTRT